MKLGTVARITSLLVAGLLACVTPRNLSAYEYGAPTPPVPLAHPDGTTHYYQGVSAHNFRETWGWAEAASYASSMVLEGRRGYLATITCPQEQQLFGDSNYLRAGGYLGALNDPSRGWIWVTGPEAGTPITFFAPYICQSGPPGCPEVNRLFWGGPWYCMNNIGYPDNGGPGLSCANGGFLVEFSDDCPAAPPELSSYLGFASLPVISIDWSTTGGCGGSTEISYSTVSPDGPYTVIASGLPPRAGHYDWLVDEDSEWAAMYLRVTVADAAGLSDSSVAYIHPVSTKTGSWGRLKAIYR